MHYHSFQVYPCSGCGPIIPWDIYTVIGFSCSSPCSRLLAYSRGGPSVGGGGGGKEGGGGGGGGGKFCRNNGSVAWLDGTLGNSHGGGGGGY